MSRRRCCVTFALVAASVAVAGCVVTSRPVSLPNGAQGLAIDCSDGFHDIADCMNYAAQHCGGPYRIIAKEEHSTPMATQSNQTVIVSSSIERILIVQCGAEK